MRTPKHDSLGCSGILPWQYNVVDPSGQTLAVYNGRQVNRPVFGLNCPPPIVPPYNQRRVYMYPVEYRSYGPDGVNVVFARDDQGAMVKRFMVTDRQGSIVMVVGSGTEDHITYKPFGAAMQHGLYRTGYLDRETDYETSPPADSLKLLDLHARKYVPGHGTFTAPDPLWMLTPEATSYNYCLHDPVNYSDANGLGFLDPIETITITGDIGGYSEGGFWEYESTRTLDSSSGSRWYFVRTLTYRASTIRIKGGGPTAQFGVGGFGKPGRGGVSGVGVNNPLMTKSDENKTSNGKQSALSPPVDNWKGVPYRFPLESEGKTSTWDAITDKRILGLDIRVQQPDRDFINAVEAELGMTLRVTDGYRSEADQNKLYAQGRTQPGRIVTNAKGGQSNHQYGLAIDVAEIINRELTGRIVNMTIAQIGMRYGFRWGGLWASNKDYPHFEMLFKK